MDVFTQRFNMLNKNQQEAVNTIEGPVMIVAGPGTGKTELLSLRVANILRQTDADPENILCLTYTNSGVTAIKERLFEIIGKESYKVAVHTFHSFSEEVMNQNNEFFYNGTRLRPADEVSQYEVIETILKSLKRNSILKSIFNDRFVYIDDIKKSISDIKKSGLTSNELLSILDTNDIAIDKINQIVAPIFTELKGAAVNTELKKVLPDLTTINDEQKITSIRPLSQIFISSLQQALDDSDSEPNSRKKTTPITAWRNVWFKKVGPGSGHFVLKSQDRQRKLRELCDVYEQYLSSMDTLELYDFDSMIFNLVHALEKNDELRFNLQEKYQYIMVDEFQDTSQAQMRILRSLTNNSVQEDTPNIMAVGDDDQAIFSFQGADISNILDFCETYPKTKIITLKDNYRSTSEILTGSRQVIIQGKNRLENALNNIDKTLMPHQKQSGQVELREAETINEEYYLIVKDIAKQIKNGVEPKNIAVLAHKHKFIEELLPYFVNAKIAVNYSRQDNILTMEPIVMIERLAQLLIALADGRHDDINALISEILSHPAWNINPTNLWQLSLTAYKDYAQNWLEAMSTMPTFRPIQQWLISNAQKVDNLPLEQMLDIIIGNPNVRQENEFFSPLYDYFFSTEKLTDNPSEYLIFLDALNVLRRKLREYHPEQAPTIRSFIDFIELNQKIDAKLTSERQISLTENAVNLMTAHGAKGLEFDTVYIVDATEQSWGKSAKGRGSKIDYPENLPLRQASDTEDERLRLFFVAITRAKRQLFIYYHRSDKSKKPSQLVYSLVDSPWQKNTLAPITDLPTMTEIADIDWYQSTTPQQQQTLKELLQPTLDNYKLNATHLNSFLDISHGGPSTFLTQNLLHFPTAKSAAASYGTAIHNTLQQVQNNFVQHGGQLAPIKDIIAIFNKQLLQQHLEKTDFQQFFASGSEALKLFFEKNPNIFALTQKSELNFRDQDVKIEEVTLTGKLDLVDLNKNNKTIKIIDYKTGRPEEDWNNKDTSKKIKLHKYRQQLLFYKILIENSRDFHNYEVISNSLLFIEPNQDGKIVPPLATDFNQEELDRFKKLIIAVWNHIMDLNFPDTSGYVNSANGIKKFEEDLIDNKI